MEEMGEIMIVIEAKNWKPNLYIESKVDESFGDLVVKNKRSCWKRQNKKTNFKKSTERIKELVIILFGELNDNQLKLRYQLLTYRCWHNSGNKKQGAKSVYFSSNLLWWN
jgi:hypothetical protein